MERLTVNAAANKLGISNEAVRKRIQRGTLPHGKRVDGSVYVCLDPEEYANEEDDLHATWFSTFWMKVREDATLIAAVLALFGVLLTQVITTRTADQNRQQTAKLEDQRAQQTAELQNQQAQESNLQTYLSDMGNLILDRGLLQAAPGSELSQLARAKTLTVALALNGERKSILLLFLNEQDLINAQSRVGPVVNLAGADLSEADLSDIDMSYTDLSGTDLANADLSDGPDYPDDEGTNLSYANLAGVNFAGANLHAANMRGANLEGAIGVTNEQLTQQGASLEGARMPDGSSYEEWR